MQIQRLETEEHPETRTLYEEVFPEDSQGFVDYYYTEKTKDNIIYAAKEDDRIQAMVHLNPYTVMVNEQAKTVHYIVAVATRKEYRKRGYMGALLRRALQDMCKEGEPFTFLMPAAESIYLPYDFRTVCEQERRFYKADENIAPGVQTEELRGEGCRELAAYADQYLSRHYQVYADRDEAYYKRLIKEYAADGGKLMLYKEAERLKDCRPFVPEEETKKPKIMVRILDVRRMLSCVGLKSPIGTCLQVTDPVIRENNCCIVLTGTEHSGIWLRNGKDENKEGTIPVAALASFLFGAETVDELCKEEGVRMTRRMKAELKKVIPLSRIYLNETV